jgi:hypothetical protein
MADSLADFERDLQNALKSSHEAFVGQYAAEINALAGLSREEIDALAPGTTDLETYDKLMTVVKEASRKNLAQAQLKARIEDLGDIAIEIAKKVPKLAALFV